MMKTNRSLRSAKSLSYLDDDVGADQVVPGTELTFEEMLPSICLKFNCPYPIAVRKEYRQDAHLKQYKLSDRNLFKKMKMKMSMIERSSIQKSKQTNETQGVLDEHIDRDKATTYIVVTSLYDSFNRLNTLAVSKTCKIPRVLIQSIGLLAPVFDTLNNITLTRCGIDGQVVYNLFEILPKTNVTEICLDQSPTKEGNYALLLEAPSKLRNLSLCRCYINDVVAQQIAERLHYPLPGSQTLQLLNLASNNISDEGARHLANALCSNRHLRYLNLSDNHITDTGASYLLNVLQEFPLTMDELMKKRHRYLSYMKIRVELLRKLMREFGVKQFDETSLGSKSPRKSLRRKSSVSLKQTRSRTMRHKSTQPVPHLPMTSMKFLMNRAETAASETLGPFVDPFSTTHLTVKNEWPYCHGNLALSYLNLAYNNLTFMTVKNVCKVVSYQIGKTNPHQSGLLKIVIDGNYMPEKSEEMEEISQLMQHNFNRYTGTLPAKQSDRKKTKASSGRAKQTDAHASPA